MGLVGVAALRRDPGRAFPRGQAVDGMVEASGSPLINEFSGEAVVRQIHFASGFEFTSAEVGNGTSRTTGAIELDFSDRNALFGELHMTGAGLVK